MWLEDCPKRCGKRHRVSMQKCPECGVYEIPRPVGEAAYACYWAGDRCDGCDAYRDHLR